jgi:8-oxo-dGTP pyrophosphatase MutT (NUDIX family)
MLRDALARYQPRSDVEAADVERVRALASAGDPWRRASSPHVTASAFVVHPPSRRVLLRWHARARTWLHVGGHADPGESDPLAIALREAREETGLDDLAPWPDARIVHVAVVPVAGSDHEPPHEHADVRYVLATGRPHDARPENPTARLRWLSIADSSAELREANLREALSRVAGLLRQGQQPIRDEPTATSSNQSVSEPSP